MSRRGLLVAGLLTALAGLGLTALGLAAEARQAWFSYLAAYVFALGIALGALLLSMLGHLVHASWLAAERRPIETVAGSVPVFALLFVPLLFGLESLYPWADPGEPRGALARHREPYLNVPAFVTRAAIYLAVLSTLSLLLRASALRRGARPRPAVEARQRRLSAVGLPATAFAVTFAAFDWLMSLEAEWYSTMYGVYVAAGGLVGAIGLVVLVSLVARHERPLAEGVPSTAYESLGTLLLTLVLVWGYVGFSQYLTVWTADLPVEISWYRVRLGGTWGLLAAALLAGHLVLPALLLLPRTVRRRPAVLAALGAWLVAVHYLDVYWLVLPALHPEGLRPHWIDATALAGVSGVALAFGAWQWRGPADLPGTAPAGGAPAEGTP